jgi:NarL family two-component system response regulator LiaR
MGQGRQETALKRDEDPAVRPRPVRVLLVDDHHFFRAGLRRLLEGQGLQVVGEAPTGEAGLELVELRRPDVVVLDLHMPGMSGLDVTMRLAATAPSVQILVLTVSSAERDVVDAIEAGAVGYLLKDAGADEIIRGIRAAADGQSVLSPPAAVQIVHRARRGERHEALETIRSELSEREREVLRLLTEGKENYEIASELFITRATVKDHVSAILFKLGVSNRVQAAIKAVRSGLF